MTIEKIEGIGECPKRAHFKYPESGVYFDGTVVKEIKKYYESHDYGDYWTVVQLIESDNPNEEDCIRFGYYRKSPKTKKYTWGSQTTYAFPVSFTKEHIGMAEKEGIL